MARLADPHGTSLVIVQSENAIELVGISTYHKYTLFSINNFLFILFPFFPGGPGGPCRALSVSFKGKHLENVIKSSKSSQILPRPPKPSSRPRQRKEKEICSTFEIFITELQSVHKVSIYSAGSELF